MNVKLKKWMPAVLTTISVAGTVGTSVLTAKAHVKALDLISEIEDEIEESLSDKERIMLTIPLYKPAILLGIGTVMCTIGLGVLRKSDQASMISAYALLNQSYSRYRDKIVALYGREVDDSIISEVVAELSDAVNVYAPGYQIYDVDSDEYDDRRLFFDTYSQRYFESSMAAVINAQYHINRNFVLGKDIPVNEFYEFLGIKPIENGDNIGWWGEDMYESEIAWIDFDNRLVEMEDGLQCYIITTMLEPVVTPDLRDESYH